MSFLGSRLPNTLYAACLHETVNYLRIIADTTSALNEQDLQRVITDLFRKTGTRLIEDIMTTAYLRLDTQIWNRISHLFLYFKLTKIICKWSDLSLYREIKSNSITRQILITDIPSSININEIINLSQEFLSVDFQGSLFWRDGFAFTDYMDKIFGTFHENWCSSSQYLLSSLTTSVTKIPKYLNEKFVGMLELNLENVIISVEEIATILEELPDLYILRNYKLVKALHKLHADKWRAGTTIKKYQLRNIDVDFSYIGCSSLAIGPVLPLDVLHLAIELCPRASYIHVRFDCSTHHDILLPLVKLAKLKKLSIACVTNGERSLLDFTDVMPVLRHHGKRYLQFLELKVIDEVDTHKIVKYCPKLKTLILSGSNYTTSTICRSSEYLNKLNCRHICPLNDLQILFFAEGGDVVCSNNIPQCFWYSTLSTSSGKYL